MVYKNLRHAFLFEAIVGFISLSLVLSVGRLGVAFLALLALRPFLLEREAGPPTEALWRLYYNAFRISVVLLGILIIGAFVGLELEILRIQNLNLTLSLIVSCFAAVHGFSGFVLSPKTQ